MEMNRLAVSDYLSKDAVVGGNFADEEQSQEAFALAMKDQRFFNVYREVWCWYYGGQPFQQNDRGRIDFVLMPKREAIDCGWRNGAIGIECKASGKKAGPVLCQMADYARAVFESEASGLLFCLSGVFVWPGLTVCGGTMASLMAQNRIGSCSSGKVKVSFSIGATGILSLNHDGTMSCHKIVSGRKSGSR